MLEDEVRRIAREEVQAALTEVAPAPEHEWYTAEEAAAYLRVGRAHLHNLVSEGRLPRHGERGRRLRFRRADLDAYVEGRRST